MRIRYFFKGIWYGIQYIISVITMLALCYGVSFMLSNWNKMEALAMWVSIAGLIAIFLVYVRFVFTLLKVG